jgi:hypothetical protein
VKGEKDKEDKDAKKAFISNKIGYYKDFNKMMNLTILGSKLQVSQVLH